MIELDKIDYFRVNAYKLLSHQPAYYLAKYSINGQVNSLIVTFCMN